MTVTLYPDQIDLTTRVRNSSRHHRAILMQSATGSGKTRMALDMIAGAARKNTTCIFAVPRRELLEQTIKTIANYGLDFGVISPDHRPRPLAPIQIAMTPTLARRLPTTAAPKMLFLDECHFGGGEMDRIVDWSKASGGWRIGLSATPLKTNGKPMGAWFYHMECGLQIAELMALGRLSKYRLIAPSSPDLSALPTRDGDYVNTKMTAFMESQPQIIGDAVKTWQAEMAGMLTIVFAASRKHSSKICERFIAAGIKAQTIDGNDDAAARKAKIIRFATRECPVLINCQLCTFGFDLAQASGMDVKIEAMIDMSPTKSLPLQLQKWGRALRAKQTPAIIADHVNNFRVHNLPDDDREWSLSGLKKRAGTSERTIPARQCTIAEGGCGMVHRPSPACPRCGRVYPVQGRTLKEVEGTMIELNPDHLRMIQRAERKVQGGAETLAELRELARRTGKNPRWADHVWNARQAKRAAL